MGSRGLPFDSLILLGFTDTLDGNVADSRSQSVCDMPAPSSTVGVFHPEHSVQWAHPNAYLAGTSPRPLRTSGRT